MSVTPTPTDDITTVSLPALLALRARAGRPVRRVALLRSVSPGGHAAVLRGRGMDYAESRVYQSGDDVRNIDWRRTARSGKWHTKLFEVERAQGVLVLVDTHATMGFGTRVRYKSVAAARAAAWLAWTAVRAGDRIGALAFGTMRAEVAPSAGVRGALKVLGALAHWDGMAAAGRHAAEPLSSALVRAQPLLAGVQTVWLLSDGWCVDAAAAEALARVARRVTLRVVIVADPLENALAPAGTYRFETQAGRCALNLAQTAARAQFSQQLGRGRQRLVDACDAAGVAWKILMTTDEPDALLAPFLRRPR